MKIKCTKCDKMCERHEMAERKDTEKGHFDFCVKCLAIDQAEDNYLSGQPYSPCKEVREMVMKQTIAKYNKEKSIVSKYSLKEKTAGKCDEYFERHLR